MPKFFHNTFTVEVLSHDTSLDDVMSLSSLNYMISQGECVGGIVGFSRKEITPKETADKLYEFGSSPDFFQLDDNGDEVES